MAVSFNGLEGQIFTQLCKYGERCRHGWECTYAHTPDELLFGLQQSELLDRLPFKKTLCPNPTECLKGHLCTFAHSADEIANRKQIQVTFQQAVVHSRAIARYTAVEACLWKRCLEERAVASQQPATPDETGDPEFAHLAASILRMSGADSFSPKT
jgi:hypothetical protein